MKSLTSLTAVVLLLTAASASQQQIDPKAFAEKLKTDFVEWNSRSTRGASIRLKEVGREKKRGDEIKFIYEIYVAGFPSDGEYDLVTWPTGDERPRTILIGVSVDKDGRLYCAGKTRSECKSEGGGPLQLTAIATPGKPFRYALFNNLPPDNPGAIIATTTIVPITIEAGDGSCSLSILRLTQNFEVAYLTAKGFQPDSTIVLDGTSFGERHVGGINTNSSGEGTALLLPYVIGHSSGTMTLNVSGSICAPSLKFDWGH